jgi:hypothetical protein
MTREQRAILQDNLEDERAEIRGIEYPSHPQVEGGSNGCLKLTTMVVVNEVSRTWVDWYAEDGRRVNGRELVELYDVPSYSQRVRVDGPETAYGGLIGQQPY